jgi:hypothetical protein
MFFYTEYGKFTIYVKVDGGLTRPSECAFVCTGPTRTPLTVKSTELLSTPITPTANTVGTHSLYAQFVSFFPAGTR